MRQAGLAGLSDQLKRLSDCGDSLETMERVVDFEVFRPALEKALAYGDGAKVGRPPYDPVAMLEVLILAAQNTVSDARMEFLIRDRLSWLWFLGFDLGDVTPDEKHEPTVPREADAGGRDYFNQASLDRLRYAVSPSAAIPTMLCIAGTLSGSAQTSEAVLSLVTTSRSMRPSKRAASVTFPRRMKPKRRQIAMLLLYPKLGIAISIPVCRRAWPWPSRTSASSVHQHPSAPPWPGSPARCPELTCPLLSLPSRPDCCAALALRPVWRRRSDLPSPDSRARAAARRRRRTARRSPAG
ncbi:MAG: transposase [Sphingomonadaceae bacterium]|nr:transposase [Sphingomonadaceae bacterium]